MPAKTSAWTFHGYNDFREVVARKDIDFIMSATPDHWHAIIALACVAAGKDVYGEKPLTRTIREGKILRDAVEASGIIWQTGSWRVPFPRSCARRKSSGTATWAKSAKS